MPTYLYACDKDKDHEKQEVVHRMSEEPEIKCKECGSDTHRVPQPMRFYFSPFDVLTSWSQINWERYKARARGHKAPRFSPDKINQPGSGIPGKDFEKRRH